MMWHTNLPSKKSSILKKVFLFLFLSTYFLVAGIYSCGGSGTGGGTPGAGGGAGAPPISIPGPTAVNMTSVTISAPDSAGTVTVTGTPGAAIGNADVRVRDLGPRLSWYQKSFINSAYAAVGDEVVVKANADGSFIAQIKALVGDRLAIDQRIVPGGYGVAIVGTVQNVPSQPTTVLPGSSKMKMTVDPGGNGWVIQGASSKKWNWTDLFISTAYAADDLAVQNISDVSCPQVGPCILQPSTAASVDHCLLSKTDSKGTDLLSLQVPHCKGLSLTDLKTGQVKGPPEINYLAVAADKNVMILKEVSPDKWLISEVLRFTTPITQVQSDIQASDLVFYLSSTQGFFQFNTKNRSLTFFPTKIGLPTALAKRGNNIIYSVSMNNQSSIVQGDVVRDPNFNALRVGNFSIPNQISEIVILGTDEDQSIDLPSGKVTYRVNRYAFIAGKKVYLLELPTHYSYADLNDQITHPDIADVSRLEKLVSVDFPEAIRAFSMIADNPEMSLLAVSDGEKVYYVDYNYSDSIPLQAFKNSRVTDLNAEGTGEVAVLVYNPVSRNFLMRTRGNSVSVGANNNSTNHDRGRSVQINFPYSDSSSELRGTRTLTGGRDIQPTVRAVGARPATSSTSTTTTPR